MLIEAVPNFSEGRDERTLAALRQAISSVPGATLLDETADADHNRSVFTLAGSPLAVEQALVAAAAVALLRIDLRRHRGVHPRIGAMDVAPLVPVEGVSWDECEAAARGLGKRLWGELGLPVYYYGRAALRADREKLENVRRGGFEELSRLAFEEESRAPDEGGPALHPSAGATAVGVRPFLIAFNVNLRTPEPRLARRIAREIRESSGGFAAVKALGLDLPERGLTQVSMNLVDFQQTSVRTVFEAICERAAAAGVALAGSELIGLAPARALSVEDAEEFQIEGFHPDCIFETRLALRRGGA